MEELIFVWKQWYSLMIIIHFGSNRTDLSKDNLPTSTYYRLICTRITFHWNLSFIAFTIFPNKPCKWNIEIHCFNVSVQFGELILCLVRLFSHTTCLWIFMNLVFIRISTSKQLPSAIRKIDILLSDLTKIKRITKKNCAVKRQANVYTQANLMWELQKQPI